MKHTYILLSCVMYIHFCSTYVRVPRNSWVHAYINFVCLCKKCVVMRKKNSNLVHSWVSKIWAHNKDQLIRTYECVLHTLAPESFEFLDYLIIFKSLMGEFKTFHCNDYYGLIQLATHTAYNDGKGMYLYSILFLHLLQSKLTMTLHWL